MPIKESSDELNPPVAVAGAAIPKARAGDFSKGLPRTGYRHMWRRVFAARAWDLGIVVAVAFYLMFHRAWFPHTNIPPEVYGPQLSYRFNSPSSWP